MSPLINLLTLFEGHFDMASLLTNVSAMTALQNLTKTNSMMEVTQKRISTGLRVGAAEDNAAYWSIATTMRSDNKSLSTVKDALGLGSATVDVMYTAMNSALDVVDEIKAKLVAARQPGVDRGKIQSEITELQSQLRGVADSASFSGENWLAVDSDAATYTATKSVVSSFTRSGSTVTVQTIDITISSAHLFDDGAGDGILDNGNLGSTNSSIFDLDISGITDDDLTDLDAFIQGADDAIAAMTDSATNLGAVKMRINLQKDFVTALMDAVTRGVGALVDADMNEESTRLQALQVQQQLGVQALSIANQNSQNILSLFR